jgi:hypothetical protein
MNHRESNGEDFIVSFLKFIGYAIKTADYVIVLRGKNCM